MNPSDAGSAPGGDPAFRAAVDRTLAAVSGRPTSDPAILASRDASLRSSDPLASVHGAAATPRRGFLRWDVFRDGTVLDDELRRRARSGDRGAVEQLYDRHHLLAHAVSFYVAASSQVASDAVVAGFRALIVDDRPGLTVRVSIAVAAREAAMAISPVPRGMSDPGESAWFVLELAYVHRLLGTEIATVLGLEFRQVARLANEGLRALAARTREKAT